MKAFQTLTSSNGNTNIYSNGLAMLGDNIFQLFYPSTGTGQTPYLLRTVVPSLANGLSAFTHSHYQLNSPNLDFHVSKKVLRVPKSSTAPIFYMTARQKKTYQTGPASGPGPATYTDFFCPTLTKIDMSVSPPVQYPEYYLIDPHIVGSMTFDTTIVSQFDVDVVAGQEYIVSCLDDMNTQQYIRLGIKHPVWTTLGEMEHYQLSSTLTIACTDVQISPQNQRMFLFFKSHDVFMNFNDVLDEVLPGSATGSLKIRKHVIYSQSNSYNEARFQIFSDAPNDLKIFYALTYKGTSSVYSGYFAKFYQNTPAQDCRGTNWMPTPQTPDLIRLSLSEQFQTFPALTINLAPDTTFSTADAFSPTLYDVQPLLSLLTSPLDPLICRRARPLKKYPAFIDPVLVHDSSLTISAAYDFYPDPLMAGVFGTCDAVNMRYELRMANVAQMMPAYLSLTQGGGVYALNVAPMTAPITESLAMKLVLVDMYGDYVESVFTLEVISATVAICTANPVMAPIIQDQAYVLGGGIEWYKYKFAHPGYDGLANDCFSKTKFIIIVKHPSGQITGPPPGFLTHSKENSWLRVEATDVKLLGTYTITITALIPTFNVFTKKINKGVTQFTLKVIKRADDYAYPCKLVTPLINDYQFDMNRPGTGRYNLPEYRVSSVECQKKFKARGEYIEISVYPFMARPQQQLRNLLGKCISITTNGAFAILEVSNSNLCSATLLYHTIAIEGFIRQKDSTFRRLSGISIFHITFSYDVAGCSQQLITAPGAAKWFARNAATQYYDVRQKLTLPTLVIDYSGYQLDPACGDIRKVQFDTNFTAVAISPFPSISSTSVTVSTLDPLLIGEYLILSKVSNAYQNVFAQYLLTVKVFDSLGCDLSFKKSPLTTLTVLTTDPPRNLTLQPMLTTPQCHYQTVYYTLQDTVSGGTQLPRFLHFLSNSTDLLLAISSVTDLEVGDYDLSLIGELNPLLNKTLNIRIRVVKPPPPRNKGPPEFFSPPEDYKIQAGRKAQYSMPMMRDPDKDAMRCSGRYGEAGTPFPKWVIFKDKICAWVFSPTDDDIGDHNFQVEIKDNNPVESLSQTYSFEVKVTESKELLEYLRQEKYKKETQNYSVGFRVGRVDEQGRVEIRFNQPMRNRTRIERLGSSELEVLIKKRDTQQEVMVNWNATEYAKETSTLSIQLLVEDPKSISRGQEKDLLKLQFMRSRFFYSESEDRYPDSAKQIFKEIPKLDIQGTPKILKSGAFYLQGAAQSFIFGNLGLNIVMSASLQQLWGMINTLQLMVIVPLFNLSFASNSMFFFHFIASVTRFNVVPAEDLIKRCLRFDPAESQPLNENFEAMGYNTHSSILNLDTIFLMVTLSMAVLVAVFLVYHLVACFLRQSSLFRQLISSIYDSLFMNYILRFFLEGFIEISLASLINVSNLLYSTSGEISSSIFAQMFGALTIFFPILLGFLILFKFDELDTEWFHTRFGAVTQDIRTDGKAPAMFNVVFTSRRLLLVLTAIQLNQWPAIQIMVYQFLSLLSTMYLISVKPFKEPTFNKLEIFNELCVSTFGYLLFMLTDFVESPPIQEFAGYAMISVIVLNFLVNIGVIARGMIQKVSHVVRHRKVYWCKFKAALTRLRKCQGSQKTNKKKAKKNHLEENSRTFNLDPQNVENCYNLPPRVPMDQSQIAESTMKIEFMGSNSALDKTHSLILPHPQNSFLSEAKHMTNNSLIQTISQNLQAGRGNNSQIGNDFRDPRRRIVPFERQKPQMMW